MESNNMEDDTRDSSSMMEMSQDCIVWDESRNLDLRELARSPMELALGNGSSKTGTNSDRLDGIKRRLEQANSAPAQEVDGIFRLLEEQSTSPPITDSDPTQPTGNSRKRQLPSSARRPPMATSSLAARRRQKQRGGLDSSDRGMDSNSVEKRQNLVTRRRRRVTNNSPNGFTSPFLNPPSTEKPSTLNNDGTFEQLLKEFSTPQSNDRSRAPSINRQSSDVTETLSLDGKNMHQHDPVVKNLQGRNCQTTNRSPREMSALRKALPISGQSQPITPIETSQIKDGYPRVFPSKPVAETESSKQKTLPTANPYHSNILRQSNRPNHGNITANKTMQPTSHAQKSAMPPPSITPIRSSTNTTTTLVSNKKEDDEFGKFDFGEEAMANLDNLLSMKSSHQVKQVNEANKENCHIETCNRPERVDPRNNADEFGDFPDIDFEAIDQAIAEKPGIQAPSSKIQTHNNKFKDLQKADDDEFGDFPDIDFDAMDQAIAGKPKLQDLPNKEGIKNGSTEDEFGDLPEIDFDAMDQVIAQRKTLPVTTSMACHVPPNGPVKNPRRKNLTNDLSFISFTRYKVVDTFDDVSSYTKTLSVTKWAQSMLKEEEKNFHRNCKVTKVDGKDIKDTSLTNISPLNSYKADGLIHLRGEWYHTPISPGDIVHLCSLSGSFQTDKDALPIVLHNPPPPGSDNDDLVLVIHPDILMTPTTISETVTCSRRAVLKSRIGSTGLTAKAPLFGTMRHDLFGLCMRHENFEDSFAKRNVHKIVRQNSESLLGAGVSTIEAENEILRVLPVIRQFVLEYTNLQKGPESNTLSNSKIIEGHGYQASIRFLSEKAHSIEEPIISPELALKGNIDAVLEAETLEISNNSFNQNRVEKSDPQKALVCLELKTGHNQNAQNAHMAQLALYTLMLQTRYGSRQKMHSTRAKTGGEAFLQNGASAGGLLLYLNQESMRTSHIAPLLNEAKSLIGQRNVVASGMYQASRPRGVLLSFDEGIRKEERKVHSAKLLPSTSAVLPELITNAFACKKCYVNRECMLYTASESNDLADLDFNTKRKHEELLSKFTGNLKQEDLSYFRTWDRLIDLEADASNASIATAWLTESSQRERENGESVSSLVFDHREPSPREEGSHVLIAFRRWESSQTDTALENLALSHGSHVVISTDGTSLVDSTNSKMGGFRHQMHIVRGFMEKVENGKLLILARREDLERIRNLVVRHKTFFEKKPDTEYHELLFRVDKDNSAVGIGTLRQNLINFLTADFALNPDHQPSEVTLAKQLRMPRLRDIVVRLLRPRFDASVNTNSLFDMNGAKIPGCNMQDLRSEFEDLNPDQKAAVVKVVSASDYTLLQGLPGTGKTTTLAYVARLLAARGNRVLITSYTHAAVDNVALKLIESNVASVSETGEAPNLIRIGQRSSCHPGVRTLLASELAIRMDRLRHGASRAQMPMRSERESYQNFDNPTVESLKKVVSSARIVCASALSVPRSPLLTHENFDVVIVDEAGQISQPAILGALAAADSFVLVGDHKQLPPLVNSELAESGGYNISMLQRLAEKYPSSIATLTYQYRMNEAICRLSSEAVYGGRLKCGNEFVRTRILKLEGFPNELPQPSSPAVYPWLRSVIDPKRSVVFVDTDNVKTNPRPTHTHGPPDDHSMESLEGNIGGRKGRNVINQTEVSLVRIILSGLFSSGVRPTSVGIITPFRAQQRVLGDDGKIKAWKENGLELSTIDRYQGRDKDVIILSTVRSNAGGKVGRLLLDIRRLNVALTRAKCKLIIVGSFSTLSKGSHPLRPLLARVNRRDQRFLLPENAVLCYNL